MRVAPTPIIDNAKLLRAVGHLSQAAMQLRAITDGQPIDVASADAIELAALSAGYARILLAESGKVAF